MKAFVFSWLFLNSVFFCPSSQGSLLDWLSFFKEEKDCVKAYEIFSLKKFFLKKKAWKIAEKCLKQKKFLVATNVFENLLKKENSIKEKKRIEKKIAELSFYKTKNYEKALKHYTKLLKRPQEPGEHFFIQYQITKSFFYLGNQSQALREVEKCFFKGISLKQKKEAFFLKTRILLEKKDFDQALIFINKQIQNFPEEESFLREYLAIIYEAKKEFLSAIKELEKINKPTKFIKKKIKHLYNRQNNQPGF